MKVIKKKVTTVTETTTYDIHPNVRVLDIVVNGVPSPRQLHKHGATIKSGDYKLDFRPIYNPDLSYLEETNPFWMYGRENSKWFEGNPLPNDVKDIDVSKIVFASSYDHSFWTVDLEPIPVVIQGNYIDASIRSNYYDLEKLHAYLSKHKQIKTISAIEAIPYYNNDGDEYCFEVTALPTRKQLKEIRESNKIMVMSELFYKPWNVKDYLGMKKFYIGKDD